MSAIEGGRVVRTRQAEGAFAAGLAVIKGTGANQVKLPTAANQAILGIAETKGDPNDVKYQDVAIISQGEATGVAGGTVTTGDLLRVAGNTGKLVAVGGEAVGAEVNVVGRAQESASSDEEFAVLLGQQRLGDQVSVKGDVPGAGAATSANWGLIYIAPFAMQLIQVTRRFEVAGGSGAAMMVKKVPSGTAKASGTDMLASAISLEATADTNANGTLHATTGNLQLAAGDAVALVPSGTLTNLVGVHATLTFRRL